MPSPETDRFERLHGWLDRRETKLRSELRAADSELASEPNQHFNDEAEDEVDKGERRVRTAMRAAEQDRDIAELNDIAQAKNRLASGQYGICIDCGIDIPMARLEAQPSALRCIACQSRLEASSPSAARLPPME